MNRIIKIGMDVHSTNYTLCAMEPTIGSEDRIIGEIQVAPDYKEVICVIESLKMKLGLFDDYSIECGYEAVCLGYTLYHQLTNAGIASSWHRLQSSHNGDSVVKQISVTHV